MSEEPESATDKVTKPHSAADLSAQLFMLALGTADENSPLCSLVGQTDTLQHISHFVRQKWTRDVVAASIDAGHVAFAHVDNVTFPKQGELNVNMMPFIMGDKSSLPKELHGYWHMIQVCVKSLVKSRDAKADPSKQVGYLTVHESEVPEGEAQRRPGLHTEGFARAPYDSGNVRMLPRWHPWGFGHAMNNGEFEGGIFLASTVHDSCRLYNVLVPPEVVGRGGDVEHLRAILHEHFPEAAKPRTHWPNEPEKYYEHAGCARSHMHMEGDDVFDQVAVRRPISLQAGELVWITDRTPHESMALQAGQQRQFFRLVAGGIDTWFAAHSTPNPLGTQPQAEVVHCDKFTGLTPGCGSSNGHHSQTCPGPAASLGELVTGLERLETRGEK